MNKIIVDNPNILNEITWRIDKSNGYVCACINEHKIYLHRFIMKCKKGDNKIVDHINGNKLDNRLCNLRLVSTSMSSRNRKAKNYYYDKYHKKWRINYSVNDKTVHDLAFLTENEAKKRASDIRINLFNVLR